MLRTLLLVLLLIAHTAPALAAGAADVRQAVQQQAARCWNPPKGAIGSETVHVELLADGSIAKPPVASGLANAGVATAAIHAVEFCAPYRLPAFRYTDWKTIDVTFKAGQ